MSDALTATSILYAACGAVYVGLAALLILQAAQAGRSPTTASLLGVASLATAAWAAACAWQAGSSSAPAPTGGWAGNLDLLRALAWYGFVLHLFRRTRPWRATPGGLRRRSDMLDLGFAGVGIVAVLATSAVVLSGWSGITGAVSLTTPGVAVHLALALCQLLLLENLYRNTEQDRRWDIVLACVGLGGLAAFELLLCIDATLAHRVSPALAGARPLLALLVCPLLAVAAARNRGWSINIQVSRSAVFHTATLVMTGALLLAIAASAELARELGSAAGESWGDIAQIGLLFGGFLAVAVLLTSGSARSLLRFALVDHFFTHRYDYRQEWMRCIDTLSDNTLHRGLHGRVVRALTQVLDSSAGMLLLREPGGLGLQWAESLNLPPLSAPLAPNHPLLAALERGASAVELASLAAAAELGPLDPAWALWLAVPLRHGGRLAGCVLVARPRALFRLDAEVLALLRIVAHEVATYLAEQRATGVLLETRELRAYGERFAFVAHDIKNVSSQLSLLLANAETHLANPEFQRDTLLTVRASVQKIGALIRRLETPEQPAIRLAPPILGPTIRQRGPVAEGVVPAERLEVLAERVRRLRGAIVVIEQDGPARRVAMDPGVFDTVVTHLLDNAIEAAGQAKPVHLRVRLEAGRSLVDITDSGPGMPPEFVRDHLFKPFRTSKQQGSGIGAFQARALLQAASGDLLVLSQPGVGTTMRLLLPLSVPDAVMQPA